MNKYYILLLRLIVFFRGGSIVVLKTSLGTIHVTIARIRGEYLRCPVYYFTNVGECILLPNGKIHQDSESLYIEEWRFYQEA